MCQDGPFSSGERAFSRRRRIWACGSATISGGVRRRLDPAGAHLRHPHRRRRQLVRRPLPDHLVAVGLLRRPVPGAEHRRRSCSPWSARCCSSCRSCCTSSATRWWRSATASRSSGIDLWMFGGVAKLERDTDSPGVEFRVAVAGPARDAGDRGALLRRSARSIVEPRRGARGRRPSTPTSAAPSTAVLGYLAFDQRARAVLQPDPGLPARRRPDRARDRLEAHRRPQPRHPVRRPPRAAASAS